MNEIFNEVVNEEKHPLELHHQPHLQQHHEGKQQHEQQHFKGLDDIHQQHHQNEVTTECLQKPSAYVKTHLIKTNYQVSENDEIKLNDSTKSVEVFTPGKLFLVLNYSFIKLVRKDTQKISGLLYFVVGPFL